MFPSILLQCAIISQGQLTDMLLERIPVDAAKLVALLDGDPAARCELDALVGTPKNALDPLTLPGSDNVTQDSSTLMLSSPSCVECVSTTSAYVCDQADVPSDHHGPSGPQAVLPLPKPNSSGQVHTTASVRLFGVAAVHDDYYIVEPLFFVSACV